MAYDDPELQDFDDDDNIENTFLTFAVAGEEYALHVSHVTEIVRLQKIFLVPDVAKHVRGVINLRSKVIPLLDVRARLGIAEAEYTDRTVVVVIDVAGSPTGLVVDGVFDISEMTPAQIEPAPSVMRGSGDPLVTGIGKRGDRISFIVDVKVLVAHAASAEAAREEILGPAPVATPS